MKSKNLNYFSAREQKYQQIFANFRTQFFKPLLFLLTKAKITPSMLSVLGLFSIIGFFYFAPTNIYLAFLFILLQLFLDALDGSLARYQQKTSLKGSLIDMIFDQSFFILIASTLIYLNIIDTYWGLLYICSYTLMIILISYLNYEKKTVPLLVRSRLLFYALIICDPYFGTSLMTPFLIIFSLYQCVVLIPLMQKAKPQTQKYPKR